MSEQTSDDSALKWRNVWSEPKERGANSTKKLGLGWPKSGSHSLKRSITLPMKARNRQNIQWLRVYCHQRFDAGDLEKLWAGQQLWRLLTGTRYLLRLARADFGRWSDRFTDLSKLMAVPVLCTLV